MNGTIMVALLMFTRLRHLMLVLSDDMILSRISSRHVINVRSILLTHAMATHVMERTRINGRRRRYRNCYIMKHSVISIRHCRWAFRHCYYDTVTVSDEEMARGDDIKSRDEGGEDVMAMKMAMKMRDLSLFWYHHVAPLAVEYDVTMLRT